jgi:RNA polymerase sigma-70 factor (sigma-E family)
MKPQCAAAQQRDGGVMGTLMAEGPVLDPRVDADAGVDALFRSHRLGMVRLALLLVDDLASAEDVVQDAFGALHRRWSTLTTDQAAVAYLRTSVVNGARSALRRRRTVRAYLRSLDAEPHADQLGESAEVPTLVADEQRLLVEAIRRLPTRQREVIVLRYWGDLAEAEIASTLGISIGSVKSSASRGRDALAAILADFDRGQA